MSEAKQAKAKPKTTTDPRAPSAIDHHIGARMRARRQELGMAQDQLARLIGVTFQQVQKYEKGVNRVSAAALYRICTALELPLAALLPATEAEAQRPESDPSLAEVLRLASRLTPEGRRVMADMARALAGCESLSKPR